MSIGFIAALLGFTGTMLGFLLGFKHGVRKEQQARIRRVAALRKLLND